MASRTRLPPHPSNFAGRDEHADAGLFAAALRGGPSLLQSISASVNASPGGLDVLLFRGVLLVAYGAVDEVVIARGTDLAAMRRLRHPRPEYARVPVSAVAFREHDGAVAAAFGPHVVVFEGWSNGARDRALVFDSRHIEVALDVTATLGLGASVSSLSWTGDGKRLAAIGSGVVVWQVDVTAGSVAYDELFSFSREESAPLMSVGSISPDGNFLAAAAMYARIGCVWALPGSGLPTSSRATDYPCAEIVHGWSGVAAMDWKPRGGGNPALMTTDRDGTLRLWVKCAPTRAGVPVPVSPGRTTGPESWMDEIARSPHAERTPRAGAVFMRWGGGGGVADDEGDALATSAAHPFIAHGAAPKPSRCHHWIIRIAGGDARAWRVRGLDDRPRAEFSRLEPGSGEALVGLEVDDDPVRRLPLSGVIVAATRAVAPIPLTTASQYKVGLVKSYAISNGERRLRSPEPPEPPTIAAVFVLTIQDGVAVLGRYDMCPTSKDPAVCRARIGAGHSSPVMSIVSSARTGTTPLDTGEWLGTQWLGTRGSAGEVLLWRADVRAGAREPVVPMGMLPGPHSAVTFAPEGIASEDQTLVGVFACDSGFDSLRLYHLRVQPKKRARSAVQSMQACQQIAVCNSRNRGNSDKVIQLVSIPLARPLTGSVPASRCAVFAIFASGRICSWYVMRRSLDDVRIEPALVRVSGRRYGHATAAAVTEEGGSGKKLLIVGSDDGCLRVYSVGCPGFSAEDAVAARDAIEGTDDEDENEEEDGVISLQEMAFLVEKGGSKARVNRVQSIQGAARIVASRNDGSLVVWERSSAPGAEWKVELSVQRPSLPNVGDKLTPRGTISAIVSEENAEMANGHSEDSDLSDVPRHSSVDISLGRDCDGDLSLLVSRPCGAFERFQRPLGTAWELSVVFREVSMAATESAASVSHIGHGFVIAANGAGLSVFSTVRPGRRALTYVSDAAGYSPSRGLFAHLLTGGRAWQTVAALHELHSFVRVAATKTASVSTYGAGRGLVPPPPLLAMLLSSSNEAPTEFLEEATPHHVQVPELNLTPTVLDFGPTPSTGRSLFAELMARSEAKLNDGQALGGASERAPAGSTKADDGDISSLADRLRVMSLAGVSRTEQAVLSALSEAAAAVKSILPSLDVSGSRFALMAACFSEAAPNQDLPASLVASALHSSSADALMNHFLPIPRPGALGPSLSQKYDKKPDKMWNAARRLGAGWWLSSNSAAQKLAERIARADFNASRDADSAALWYVALGRRTALAALYKAQQNTRMSQFLLRNFSNSANRIAAGKNAYALVSKHRLELAVAFFILAGDVKGAISLIRTRCKDEQLAILLSRLLDNGDHLGSTLDAVTASAEESGDDHCRAMALWLNGRHFDALIAASRGQSTIADTGTSELGRALGCGLPSAVHALTHVLAMADRPPVCGTPDARQIVAESRDKAARALLGDGSPVAALAVIIELTKVQRVGGDAHSERPLTQAESHAVAFLCSEQAIAAAADVIKGRAVCIAGAVLSDATSRGLLELVAADISELVRSPLGQARTIQAAIEAAGELSSSDEVDASIAIAMAAFESARNTCPMDEALLTLTERTLENCLKVAVSRSLFHVQSSLSLVHRLSSSPTLQLLELLAKSKSGFGIVQKSRRARKGLTEQLMHEFKGAMLALRFAIAFLRGDWPDVLSALRACEVSWPLQKAFTSASDSGEDADCDDAMSHASNCSTLAPDSVSVEALRHVASNPAVLRMSPSLGHQRRLRRAPAMSLVDMNGASATAVVDDALGAPTLSVSSDDPFAIIRIHPALSSTLGAAAAAYLASHLASRAAEFTKLSATLAVEMENLLEGEPQSSGSLICRRNVESCQLMDSAETLEQIAEDAIAQWIPLLPFGSEAELTHMAQADESAGAFVDLWTTLGCLPEYAPSLSEAATVAAAEMAAAASRAAVEAAEQRDGGRRRRRRRERKGEVVANVAKEGLQLFDTTSADSLYGAYPVRFSSSAKGPWSGRGRHASLYSERGALFRKLCVSSTDPPAVIVATPKGIQEIVPSSYTTMPAGFRSHYTSCAAKGSAYSVARQEEENRHRLKALEENRAREQSNYEREEEAEFMGTYGGFVGEGPYIPLPMEGSDDTESSGSGGRLRSSFGKGKHAVWRHQVEATALAAHPLRRRFASGGTDGVVRLWDFADPISLAALREENFGRVSDISFSAYGNTIMAVYSSGRVAVWDDPDIYSSMSSSSSRRRHAKIIYAFDGRAASGGIFLDERHTIAVVGDPTSPTAIGHSLRVFDTREASSSFHPSWSAKVHNHGEARCLALLVDRMRVVTGGLDGSISIVDLRTKACVAELPAHNDEVTCLALEQPRGRALVSGSAGGEIKLWDSRTLLQLDVLQGAHVPTRHYWSGSGIGGLVGSYGTQAVAVTDRSLISCGGDGVVKIWGPGWSDYDLNVL